MKIKSFMQFINESSGYQFGCVMLKVPFTNWEEITSIIEPEDIYDPQDDKHGIEDDPHLTLLYGLHESVSVEDIKNKLSEFVKDYINLQIDGIDIFENEEFDVVKFNVKLTPELDLIHKKLSELPNSDKYPIYKPHITISYVNKGTGKKYVNPNYKLNVNNLGEICFSQPSGNKTYFEL